MARSSIGYRDSIDLSQKLKANFFLSHLMTLLYILLAGVFLLGAINIMLLLSQRKATQNTQDAERLQTIAKQLDVLDERQERLHTTVDAKLENIHRAGQNQFREAREIIGDITNKSDRLIEHVNRKLGDLDKTNQKIVDFSAQLRGLQDILSNPKQRGVLGEVILEQVLSNILPTGNFKMQHTFANGDIVDAVVFVRDKIVPIDSKFSLENYNRFVQAQESGEKLQYEKAFINDLKLRIQETSKYIKPEEGTTDFAFMFIPSEAIYYELLANSIGSGEENLIQRSAGKYRVIIVSPTSFLAYLQTVLQGLKALEIEENARHIQTRVAELSRHWNAFDVYMQKLAKTMTTTVNHFNHAYKELGKVDRDVMRITQRKEQEILPEEVAKPTIE